MPELSAEYEALRRGAGLVDLAGRTLAELTGGDRATFLHNLCTGDIRRLEAGEGCEAFVTSVQGKVLEYLSVFAGAESLTVETVPGQAERLLTHFDRYIIREDVQLHDRSDEWHQWLLGGAQAAGLLAPLAQNPLPEGRLAHAPSILSGVPAVVRRVDWTGPECFLLQTSAADAGPLGERLLAAGAVSCGAEALETARIEAGTPWYGRDIDETNLPQEVARDDRAISFTKGCYLGQETVARIDALGHVNKTLCGLRFAGSEVPPPGLEINGLEKLLAVVTSATWSPALDAPLALAYVRRGHNEVGKRLDTPLGKAEVIRLPV